VSPSGVFGNSVAHSDFEPSGIAEVLVLCPAGVSNQDVRADVFQRKVGYRVATGLMKKDNTLAVSDPLAG
jgi:hypothetical protein